MCVCDLTPLLHSLSLTHTHTHTHTHTQRRLVEEVEEENEKTASNRSALLIFFPSLLEWVDV